MDAEQTVGGLRCSEVLARLSDFLDGALAPDDHAQVVAHVGDCDNCERFGGAFTAAVRAIRGLRNDPTS